MSRRLRDPITTEIVRNELGSVVDEIATTIVKTARTQLVKSGDFAAMLADRHGRLLGSGAATPVQVPALRDLMVAISSVEVADGDVLVTNDPYSGMGHLPDLAVVAPCVWHGDVVAFAVTYSHHHDIGGRFAGGLSTEPREIYEEGLRVPIVKLYERGRRNAGLIATFAANIRNAQDFVADLEAKVAGTRGGVARLTQVLDRFGQDAFDHTVDYLFDYGELAARELIASIPDGAYEHEQVFDEGSSGAPVRLAVRLTVRGDALEIDFSGSDDQVDRAINVPYSYTKGAALGALRCVSTDDVLINEGFARPISFVARDGSVVRPRMPAPVGGRAPMIFAVFETVTRALAKALPERVAVPGESADMWHFAMRSGGADLVMGVDQLFGGWGGRAGRDGVDGIAAPHIGHYAAPSVEGLEHTMPVVCERFQYVPDTGGPGASRGSLGVERTWRVLAPAQVTLRSSRLGGALGLSGGGRGGASFTGVNRDGIDLETPESASLRLELQPGDILRHAIGGAGGHGDPFTRPADRVRDDVVAGKLSVSSARRDYGVAVDPISMEIDHGETDKARAGRSHDTKAVTA